MKKFFFILFLICFACDWEIDYTEPRLEIKYSPFSFEYCVYVGKDLNINVYVRDNLEKLTQAILSLEVPDTTINKVENNVGSIGFHFPIYIPFDAIEGQYTMTLSAKTSDNLSIKESHTYSIFTVDTTSNPN